MSQALATLSIDLVARVATLQEGLDKATRLAQQHVGQIEGAFAKLNGIASTFGTLLGGAFAGAGIVQFVGQTALAIDALNDAADATGSTVEQLSGLEQVALRNGESLDTVTGILVKFNAVLKESDGKNVTSQVLKTIGLDAEKLRQIDPAEALRQTAVALSQFADDGNKARIIQELFGKSVREAAPFLKDLAATGQLNATVTAKQAGEAEQFNKQLAEYSTNFTNAARALASELLPALNDMTVRIKGINEAASNDGGGLAKTLLVPLETAAVLGVNVAYVMKQIGAEIGGIAAQAAAVLRLDFGGAKAIGEAMKADAAAARVAVDERTAQLLGLSKVQQQLSSLPAASYSNEGRNAGKKLGDISGLKALTDPKKVDPRLTGGDLFANAFGGKLADSLAKDGPLVAEGLTSITEALLPFNQRWGRLQDMLAAGPNAELEKTRSDMLLLSSAFEEGLITVDQYVDAVTGRLGLLPEAIKPALDEMTEFTKEFQRNVQDSLGDTILSTLKGDFASITKLWGNMLLNMGSQAIAADLGNTLLGKLGANGVRSGGLLDGLFGLLGFAKGGVFAGGAQVTAFANGGVVGGPAFFGMRGGMGLMGEAGPEAIIPLKRGKDGKLGVGGSGQVNHNYYVSSGVTRNELTTALQLMQQQVEGRVYGTMRSRGLI
jgi:hypothetical protein